MKRIVVSILLVAMACIFASCSESSGIDFGGEDANCKPISIMAVRIMLDKDIFNRDDKISVKLGFGFIDEQPVPSFVEAGAVIVFKIEAIGFIIEDESDAKSNNGYEKEFAEYSDNKFVCTVDNERYIPNYYKVYGFEFFSDLQSDSGTINISATLDYRNGGYDGKNERLYYAVGNDKIAFSIVSEADAQKKLK